MNHDNWLILNAFLNVPEDDTGRWQKIADAVPGTTAEEMKAYYERLEYELSEIETGSVELPNYEDDEDNKFRKGDESAVSSDSEFGTNRIFFGAGNGSKQKERKRGTPWTVEEHKRFLEGLQIYGRGDWRSISRNIVVTRTATQVASHAQKYFLRQKEKEKKRSSIHDITTAVVQAQPKPSMPPTPPMLPAASVYVPAPPTPTPSPTHCYESRCRGVQVQSPSSTSFYGGQGIGLQSSMTPPSANFYDGQERGATPPLTPVPVNFYALERRGMTSQPTLQPNNFYDQQRPPMMENGFQQNFIYYPF